VIHRRTLGPATVIAPDQPADTVVFCYPGGGYGRGYYDLRPDHSLADHSQAEHHARHGCVVVAVDHAATEPTGLVTVGRRNAVVAAELLGTLRTDGVLGPHATVVGLAQSMGAAVLTVHQAECRTFDAVALLGWSAGHTTLPDPPPGIGVRSREHYRWAYHWDDEPAWLVDADIGPHYPERAPDRPPWGSATRPVSLADVLRPGCVTPWAARLDVPVLVGLGARDVCADPAGEPANYPASPRVEVARFERVAHMHNFGPGRVAMWDRLVRFYRTVAKETAC
jgi:hypothetical protein